jgi:hypothetical protein
LVAKEGYTLLCVLRCNPVSLRIGLRHGKFLWDEQGY